MGKPAEVALRVGPTVIGAVIAAILVAHSSAELFDPPASQWAPESQLGSTRSGTPQQPQHP